MLFSLLWFDVIFRSFIISILSTVDFIVSSSFFYFLDLIYRRFELLLESEWIFVSLLLFILSLMSCILYSLHCSDSVSILYWFCNTVLFWFLLLFVSITVFLLFFFRWGILTWFVSFLLLYSLVFDMSILLFLLIPFEYLLSFCIY